MKKPVSTELTAANIARIKDLLAETPPQLKRLSEDQSDKQLRQPLGPGERSFTEARSSEAIYLALLANEPLFIDLHPERQWGKLLRYDRFAYSDLLAYFKFRRSA